MYRRFLRTPRDIPLSPEANRKALAWAKTLAGVGPRNMREVTLRQMRASLLAVRPRFEGSKAERAAFDLPCDGVDATLRRAVGEVRFARPCRDVYRPHSGVIALVDAVLRPVHPRCRNPGS